MDIVLNKKTEEEKTYFRTVASVLKSRALSGDSARALLEKSKERMKSLRSYRKAQRFFSNGH